MTRSLESLRKRAEKRGRTLEEQKKEDWKAEEKKEKENSDAPSKADNGGDAKTSMANRSVDPNKKPKRDYVNAGDRDRQKPNLNNPKNGFNPKNGPGSKPNDWPCHKCSNSNYADRQSCNRCGEQRQASSTSESKPAVGVIKQGDWPCHKCSNSNFASRQNCNRCDAPRQGPASSTSESKPAIAIAFKVDRAPAGVIKQGDWPCHKCSNNNFASRQSCNRCGEQRQGPAPGTARGAKDNFFSIGNAPKDSKDKDTVAKIMETDREKGAHGPTWAPQASGDKIKENERLREITSNHLKFQEDGGKEGDDSEWATLSSADQERGIALINRSKRQKGKKETQKKLLQDKKKHSLKRFVEKKQDRGQGGNSNSNDPQKKKKISSDPQKKVE